MARRALAQCVRALYWWSRMQVARFFLFLLQQTEGSFVLLFVSFQVSIYSAEKKRKKCIVTYTMVMAIQTTGFQMKPRLGTQQNFLYSVLLTLNECLNVLSFPVTLRPSMGVPSFPYVFARSLVSRWPRRPCMQKWTHYTTCGLKWRLLKERR